MAEPMRGNVTIWMLLLFAAYVNTETLENSVEEGDDEFSPTIFDPAHPYKDANSVTDNPTSDKRERVIIPDWAVFLPHERYCQYFYVFDGSQTSIFRCVNGYRFDAEKLQCLKSSSVDCGRRQKNVGSSEESKVGINFRCPSWSGIYPHGHYCHLLYDCQNKKPYLLMCPPGMLYDAEGQGCTEDRNSVNCGRRENIYKDEDPDTDVVLDHINERYTCPTNSGIYPHPKYCNKFIRCWFGIGSVYLCPKGAFYDIDLEKCRSKKSVYCGGRIDPDDNEEGILVEKYPEYECPALNGRFRHEDCRKFYKCVDGNPSLYLCPYEQRFDPQQLRCRFQEAGEDICNKETIEDEEEFICPAREGTFVDEQNCGSYYKCKNGKAQHINCSNIELFDPDWKSCAEEKDVTCGDRTLPGDDPNEDGSNIVDENPKHKCKKRHGRFTHEQICNWYYHCKDGKATVRTCPKGQFFDAKQNTCEDNVDCGRRKPTDDDVITTVKPPEFACPQKSGKFPHPKNCAAYYVCEKNKFRMFTCQKGKLYNEKSRNCEKEEKVTCSNRDLPDNDPDSRILDPNPDFKCPSTHGFFDHFQFCDWYYYCRDSQSSLWECGKGKYFDRNSRTCNAAVEVICGERQKPEDRTTTTTTTERPTEPPGFKCPKAEGEFPHERCDKFYHCQKWSFHEHECPKDKLFDANKNKCEPKSRVSCGNRINPDDVIEPSNFKCPKAEGEFPHERCDKFYHCQKWNFHEHNCPKDKLFDANKNKCEPKDRVSCGNRVHPDGKTESPPDETTIPVQETTTPVEETTIPAEETTIPAEETTIPAEETTIPVRETTTPVEETTPTEKQTLPTQETTQPEKITQTTEQTTLGTQTTPEPAIETTTNKIVTADLTTTSPSTEITKDDNTDKIIDPNPSYECKKPNGKFAHDEYCHYYYECRGNSAKLRQCPKSKYFHLERGTCEDWFEVSCGNRLKPEDIGSTADDFNSTPIKTSPNPDDKTTKAGREITAEPVSEFECKGKEGEFPHERYCHYYYTCKNNNVTISRCPEGQYFDVERGYCEEWYMVTCGDRLTPEEVDSTMDDFFSTGRPRTQPTAKPDVTTTPEPSTEKPKPDFKCPTKEGNYPHERNCGKYYRCVNSEPEEIMCPKGYLYDLNKEECNLEDDTNCGDRIHPNDNPDEPDEERDKVIDPDPEFDCTTRHGCFTHEMFCKWYYYCHDKRPEVRECSGDQYFDSVRNKCLEWWMVFCDSRSTPDYGSTTVPTSGTDSSSVSSFGTKVTDDELKGSTTTDSSNRGTGVTDSDSRGTGNTERWSHGTGGTDSGSRGTGVTDSGNPGTGNTDRWSRGTGVTDSGNRGTGNTDKWSRGTGVTDSGSQETGVTDSGNRGTGNTDRWSRGTGVTDGGNRGTGHTDRWSRGTGVTDSGNRGTGNTDRWSRGTGVTDGGNRGTGNTDRWSRGTGITDGGNRGTGHTDRWSRGTGVTDNGSRGTGVTDSGNHDTGNTDRWSRGTGVTDSGNRGTGHTDRWSRGTGVTDNGSRGTGVTDSGNRGTGNTDRWSRGTGVTDRGTGNTDRWSRGTGVTDNLSRGTGVTDSGNHGTGNTDRWSRGTGVTDSGNRGTGHTDRWSRGTGVTDDGSRGTGNTDRWSRGTGVTDSGNRGTGNTDRWSRGTGLTDNGNRGTGNTDKWSRGTGVTDRWSRETGETDGRTQTKGTTESVIITSAKPIEDLCKEEDGDFAHPDRCREYYTCKDGDYTLNECPKGTMFHYDMRICFNEDKVDCGNRFKPTIAPVTDDCDEWLRTSKTSNGGNSTPSLKENTPEGTGGTESSHDVSESTGKTDLDRTSSGNDDSTSSNGLTKSPSSDSTDVSGQTGSGNDDSTSSNRLTKGPSSDSTEVSGRTGSGKEDSTSSNGLTKGPSSDSTDVSGRTGSGNDDSTSSDGLTKGPSSDSTDVSGRTGSGNDDSTSSNGLTKGPSSDSTEVSGRTGSGNDDSTSSNGLTKGPSSDSTDVSGRTGSGNDDSTSSNGLTKGPSSDSTDVSGRTGSGNDESTSSNGLTKGPSSDSTDVSGRTGSGNHGSTSSDGLSKGPYSDSTDISGRTGSGNDDSTSSDGLTKGPSSDSTEVSGRTGSGNEDSTSSNRLTNDPPSKRTGSDVSATTPQTNDYDTKSTASVTKGGKDESTSSGGVDDKGSTKSSDPTEKGTPSGSVSDVTTMHTTQHPCLTHTHSTGKPTGPPETGCSKDDIECILEKTKDVWKWYKCPKRQGNFPHPLTEHLFIRCRNWHPMIKKCGNHSVFSPIYMKCIHPRT